MIYITYIFLGATGLIIGSFLGLVIDRLPHERSLILGRSTCDSCKKKLNPLDLVPVLSYISQNGRCRYCKEKLSLRYPFIELLTAFFFLFTLRFSSEIILSLILVTLLIVISFIDIDTMIIYDRFHIYLILLALINGPSLQGALVTSIPLLLIALITKGVGGGDIKLCASSGLLLGPLNAILAFSIASLLGGIYGLFLLKIKNIQARTAIPFGPFLCIGIFLSFVLGTEIITAYLNLFIY